MFEKLRSRLEGRDNALLIIDLDRFKEINDRYGHDIGDRALCCVSALLQENFRAEDYICRIGGDEFVVIMRGRDYDNRKMLMDLLEAENRTHSVYGGAVIACGISDYVPGEDTKFSDVFVRADAQMYENKNLLKQQGPFPGTM